MRTRAGQLSGRRAVVLVGTLLTLGWTRAHLCIEALWGLRVVSRAVRARFAARRFFWERVDLEEGGREGERGVEGEEGRGEGERVRAVQGVVKAGRVVVVKKRDMSWCTRGKERKRDEEYVRGMVKELMIASKDDDAYGGKGLLRRTDEWGGWLMQGRWT